MHAALLVYIAVDVAGGSATINRIDPSSIGRVGFGPVYGC